MEQIYLDYAATTPALPEVVEAMRPYFTEKYGNPSSIHSAGQESRAAIEKARSTVAGLIGCCTMEVVFTSGGTEADNHAIKGVAIANREKGDHIITTSIEHHAVLETCKFLKGWGFDITVVPVGSDGIVDPADIKKAITKKTILISVMHANNEVGSIQPVEEIGTVAREAGVCFHVDAVQTAGHLPVDVEKMHVDLLSISAHKLYGPKGVGMLYMREGVRIVPFMNGGEQEQERRAGTENVPGIVGFGKAVEVAVKEMDAEATRLTALRDRLIHGIRDSVENVTLNGHPTRRLPNNVNYSFDFIEGESLLAYLDTLGIYCSTGSACSSANSEPSHVLTAMGMSVERARGSIRFTLGKWTTDAHISTVIEAVIRNVKILRSISPLANKRR
jgi:cysteine desulfurase